MSDSTVRVALPIHLRTLTGVDEEIGLVLERPVTVDRVLDVLEVRFPMLRGTIRDHGTRRRRAFIRYFACGADLSHEATDQPLPAAVAEGAEPFCVVGAISGG